MNTHQNVRQKVRCAVCKTSIIRTIWNYGKNRPITLFFCANPCKAAWQRAQKEALGYTREWLIDQYITQGKSANQIAKEIGRNSKRVWEWIVDYGIPTRSRGYNTSHLPKDGSSFKGKKHTTETRNKIRAMRIKDGHVPYLKNGQHWLKSVSPENHPNWKGGVTPERQTFYASLKWRKCVAEVWRRDDAACQRCGLDHRTVDRKQVGFHVHHIDSFTVKARRAVVSNLVLLCDKCHRWVHSRKNTERVFLGEGQP